MKKGLIFLASMGAIFLSGCATIIGSGQPSIIQLASIPQGAAITAIGLSNSERLSGETPTSLTLNKNSDYEITFELGGCKSQSVIVRRSINGWFWGNILIGGIPGWIIDAATNEMWVHSTTIIELDLEATTRNQDGTLTSYALIQYFDDYDNPYFARVPIILYPIS